MTSGTRPLPRPAESAVLFLAGPVIWYLHFWLVYLLAEAGCVAGTDLASETMWSSQTKWLTVAIIATTAAAVALTAWFTLRAWRRWRTAQPSQGTLAFGGFVMGLLFMLAILMVGMPALVMPPC